MRVALCLSGQMRTLAHCWESLDRHLIEPLKPDIFVHTWSHRGVVDPVKDWKRCLRREVNGRTYHLCSESGEYYGDPEDHEITAELMESLFEPKGLLIEDVEEVERREGLLQRIPEWLRTADPVYTNGMLHNLYTQHMAHRVRLESGLTHDLVVNTVPDLLWYGPLHRCVFEQPEFMWSESATINPAHQFSCKLSVSSVANMNLYAGIYPCVDEILARPYCADDPRGWPIGERLIYQYLLEHGATLAYFRPLVTRLYDIHLPRHPVWRLA